MFARGEMVIFPQKYAIFDMVCFAKRRIWKHESLVMFFYWLLIMVFESSCFKITNLITYLNFKIVGKMSNCKAWKTKWQPQTLLGLNNHYFQCLKCQKLCKTLIIDRFQGKYWRIYKKCQLNFNTTYCAHCPPPPQLF